MAYLTKRKWINDTKWSEVTERFRLAEVDLNYEIDDLTIGKLEKMNLQEIINRHEYLKQYFKGRD